MMRKLVLFLSLLLSGYCGAACDSKTADEKQGYWWYQDCPSEETSEDNEEYPDPGPLPAASALMKMHPKQLEKIHEERKQWAIYAQTPEAVKDYYVVTDVIRRKSLAFTALSKYVMMTNPELNSKSQYPVVNPARKVATQVRDTEVQTLINSHRGEYAMAFFTSRKCSYCPVQRSILNFFQDVHGWDIKEIDIDDNPSLALRFNVNSTPMTMIVERGSERWMPVSVGVESLPDIQSGVYRAIRMLTGQISPSQYLLDESNEGGFFDPSALPKEGSVQ